MKKKLLRNKKEWEKYNRDNLPLMSRRLGPDPDLWDETPFPPYPEPKRFPCIIIHEVFSGPILDGYLDESVVKFIYPEDFGATDAKQ